MTRINSAIPPKCLTDEHLLSEHREIKRICTFANNVYPDAPKEFVLGTGHIHFFATKPVFTLNRYVSLHQECLDRGFSVDNYSRNWGRYSIIGTTPEYVPTAKERALLVERITDRLLNTRKEYWHYYGKRITKQEAIELL